MAVSLLAICFVQARPGGIYCKELFLCTPELEGKGKIPRLSLSLYLLGLVYGRRAYCAQARTSPLSDKTNHLGLLRRLATVKTAIMPDLSSEGLLSLEESLSSSITSISEIKDYINHELERA